MRKNILIAGVAAAILIPSFAMAQETCDQRSSNRTAGTIVGAGIGALLGSAVAGHGHKGDGAIVGGIGGAVVGNQAAKGDRDCVHAYGYYDNNGNWHSNSVARTDARGYYDRQGEWVDGAPTGHWDNDGRWVVTASAAPTYGAPANYVAGRRDISTRESFLEERIHRARDDGSLTVREARNATRSLDSIRRQEASMRRYNGRLNDRDEAYIQAKLDVLSRQVRADRQD